MRQRARQLEFLDFAKCDSLEGMVYRLEYKDKGCAKVTAFPLEDHMPEEWMECLSLGTDMSTTQASKK